MSAMRGLSSFLYRRSTLYLLMLLIPPLLWFGVIYIGSLFALLWQSFYTFDDFTMVVTPELTWANYVALFNPATQKADRVGAKRLEDGRKVRVFKANGEQVDA